MTSRPLIVAASIAALTLSARWAPSHAAAKATPLTALPTGARQIAALSLPHATSVYAVEYRVKGRTLIAVVAPRSTHFAITWKRSLGQSIWSLLAPGPAGLFEGVTKPTSTGAQRFFAFTYAGGHVSSALSGVPSGVLTADRGIVVGSDSVTTRIHDAAHIGSVSYRTDTQYAWSSGQYASIWQHHFPDYGKGKAPRPNLSVHTQDGSVRMLKLEVASTETERETGLMNRPSLDPDAGMIFVWTTEVTEAFWMHNTLIPLSIAFVDKNRHIVDIQEMDAMTDDLHFSVLPYQYAVEASAHYFSSHDIQIGDTVQLHLSSSTPAS